MYLNPGMYIIYEDERGERKESKILKTAYGIQIGDRDELYLENKENIFIEQVVRYKNNGEPFSEFPFYKPLKDIPVPKIFNEWLADCKSYKDVDEWFRKYFSFEHSRFKKSWSKEEKGLIFVPARSAEETYSLRIGSCQDCVKMIKYCLNKINPYYNARILTLRMGEGAVHFLPLFDLEDGIYLIEYGSWAYNMHGVWGPFKDHEDIINNFYLKLHPRHRQVEKFYLGWPPVDYFIGSVK